MTDPTQPMQPKKGMSKGCLVALIVGGAILVLLIVGVVYMCTNAEKMAKFGVTTMMNGAKQMVAEAPPEGVDTTQFNSIIDQFNAKLQTDSVDIQKMSIFLQALQPIPEDEIIDAQEIEIIYNQIFTLYPELEPEGMTDEIPADADSTMMDEATE